MIWSPKPTSLVLVGSLFLSIFLNLGLAEQYSSGQEELNKLKEVTIDLLESQKNTDLGQLNGDNGMIYYPWASRQTMGVRNTLPSSERKSPSKDGEIVLNNALPSAIVSDISAINSINKMDLAFRDSQMRDSLNGSPINSLSINVIGDKIQGKIPSPFISSEELPGLSSTSQRGKFAENAAYGPLMAANPQRNAGNYLDIDVSGISVSAINTVEGGSAVATSNIVIEPVQIIICDQAVKDKLI